MVPGDMAVGLYAGGVLDGYWGVLTHKFDYVMRICIEVLTSKRG